MGNLGKGRRKWVRHTKEQPACVRSRWCRCLHIFPCQHCSNSAYSVFGTRGWFSTSPPNSNINTTPKFPTEIYCLYCILFLYQPPYTASQAISLFKTLFGLFEWTLFKQLHKIKNLHAILIPFPDTFVEVHYPLDFEEFLSLLFPKESCNTDCFLFFLLHPGSHYCWS